MSDWTEDEVIVEVRGAEAGPSIVLQWHDENHAGIKLRNPFIRMCIKHQGQHSTWVNAEEVHNLVEIMRQKRAHQNKE